MTAATAEAASPERGSRAAAFTDDDREKLRERLDAIDKVRQPMVAARKPFDDAIKALDELHDAAIEEAGVELLDAVCEGCDILLVKGDLGHESNDGVTLCEACSPTWADILAQYREPDFAPDDAEAHAEGLAAAEATVAAGHGDAKHVWRLS